MTPAIWLTLAVNFAAFLFMGVDKFRAVRGKWRYSERALFLFPLLGGALGGLLGLMLFRHKTRKWYFVWGFFLLAIAQLMALLYVVKQTVP